MKIIISPRKLQQMHGASWIEQFFSFKKSVFFFHVVFLFGYAYFLWIDSRVCVCVGGRSERIPSHSTQSHTNKMHYSLSDRAHVHCFVSVKG